MRNYVPIDKEEIPQRFQMDLAEETFTFEFNYNESADFFTVDLYDAAGNILVYGEKLVLGIPLWADIVNPHLPGPSLVPLDESGKEDRITYENFGVSVFLYIDDVSSEEGESDVV
ncbi:phage baseplate plug family protein [Peribacillus sp. B-H-3]|uniref:phage baseplate plug family protein n=1 Tax=Peribacillus sp. B-H-3 TaxID=3400420 RepID=UPI003B01EB76